MDFTTQEKEMKKGATRVMNEQEKLERKIERLVKKVIETKYEITQLQENLDLTYDKLRDLGVTEKEVTGWGKIKEQTITKPYTDLVELANEIGQDVIDKYTTIKTSNPFYRVTTDKAFYEKH